MTEKEPKQNYHTGKPPEEDLDRDSGPRAIDVLQHYLGLANNGLVRTAKMAVVGIGPFMIAFAAFAAALRLWYIATGNDVTSLEMLFVTGTGLMVTYPFFVLLLAVAATVLEVHDDE